MIRHAILALAMILCAGPAMALSCMRPDAVRMFEYARDSEDIFYVIKGRIDPVSDYDVPTVDSDAQPKMNDAVANTPVRIKGVGLGRKGFSVPVDVAATVQLSCLSVWCSGPPPDGELLMIVKKETNALTFQIGPCGGTAIPWSKDAEDRLLQCHLSNNCEPADF